MSPKKLACASLGKHTFLKSQFKQPYLSEDSRLPDKCIQATCGSPKLTSTPRDASCRALSCRAVSCRAARRAVP
eukprot:7797918-Pyramimonas_sp.AAC.1